MQKNKRLIGKPLLLLTAVTGIGINGSHAAEPVIAADSQMVISETPATATATATATPAVTDLELPTISIVASRGQTTRQIGGTVATLSRETLSTTHPMTVNEAIRKISGIHVRDEEGFGLRPNIGIRGLNPTRSTKVTLLEDGLPLAYAPYGDNASYYHPSIDRYQRIEVLKGSDTLRYGPQTIGGVINYITPSPSLEPGGQIQLSAGNRDFANARLNLTGMGLLLDYNRKQGQGARENMEHELDDLNLKYALELNERNRLILRANLFREDSQLTYSGLTQAEFEKLGPSYNPFKNDNFNTERRGASVSHELRLSDSSQLVSNIYYSQFDRDWWRQASTTTDGQCGAAFTSNRLAGNRVDPDTCNSAQGRLRSYTTWGIEPRLDMQTSMGELKAGLRYHREEQDRRQVNARSATGRTGDLAEDNLRELDAYSAFISHRFDVAPDWSVTPIVRYENIDAVRTDRRNGNTGNTRLDEVIGGLGITWNPDAVNTIFFSAHQGFAPPRVEDLISGSGGVVEVDPEKSVNLELGLRSNPVRGMNLQAAYFRNAFDNLIAVGSIAGGSTPLSQGEALFEGVEFSLEQQVRNGWLGRVAYTWLPTAEQTTAFRNVATGALVGSRGKRQPYAPEHNLTLALGYATPRLRGEVEAQYVGSQYSDFANTVLPTANGQQGRISDYTVLNASLNLMVSPTLTTFITGKNLTDEVYIVDRTRGIQVGMPRLVQAGVRYQF